jgi:tRNA (mo5U34)-methyltransferase
VFRRVAFAAVDAQELQDRIAAFPRWHYRFEFDNGVSTPVPGREAINRHEQRRRYFFEPLLSVCGGSLSGRRVLDLGCNAGFWSLLAVEAGADFVLGIDGKQMFIDQANLVFETKGVDQSRYRFEQGNIFDHDFTESFDLVLCLGLLDHVAKPVELFELIAGVDAEIVVIDTDLSRARSSFFEISSLYDPRSAVDYPMVLLPTRDAVIELAQQFDFEAVPLAYNMTDYLGCKDYQHHRRLAFICAKRTTLDRLERAKRAPFGPWWLEKADPRRALARLRG